LRLRVATGFLSIALCAHGSLVLNTPDGPIPGSAGDGLPTSFYNFATAPNSIANSDAIVSTFGPPTATFTTLTPVFPVGGNSTSEGPLQTFVGSNGTNFSSNPSTTHNSYFLITGFLAVRAAGTQRFQLLSDDGSQFLIGGQVLINNDGDHGYGGTSDQVTFTQAGLYSFQLKFFEDGGGIGLALYQDTLGSGPFNTIAPSDLYSSVGTTGTPEPASFLLAGGVLGILMLRRPLRRSTS
jgi:hypothetical protein